MSKRYICKNKFHVCHHISDIYENPQRKTLLTHPVPSILKQLIERKNDIFIFTLLCGTSERFHLFEALKRSAKIKLYVIFSTYSIQTTWVRTVFCQTPYLCHFHFLNCRDT